MKKALVISLVIAMTASIQAASFVWGAGGVTVTFGGSALNSESNKGTGYLVLLGSGSELSDLYSINYTAPGIITPAESVMSKDTSISGPAAARGRISGEYDNASVANGQVYGMYITYNDGTDTWYNFSSTQYTVSGLEDATSSLSNATFAFDFAKQTTITADGQTPSGWTRINIPVTPVPEPATGALALAGIALLFRRRKA